MEQFLDNIFDIRDVIEYFEQLENDDDISDEELLEFKEIESFLYEVKGNGGDEQWRGDWYPITFIKETYFVDYCEQELEDCGYIPNDFPHWIIIDYEATSNNMKQDYQEIDILGETYYYR